MKPRQSGFTLIELMVVVAIIAVLAAIALPAYQVYTARAQVSEGISLATSAQVAVADYYGNHGQYPPDNDAAGLDPPQSIKGRYIASVEVGNLTGTISITFNSGASATLHGQLLTMQATDTVGSLRWQCGGVDSRYLPASCRP